MGAAIACPICGGEMPSKHRPGVPWTPQELLIIRRLIFLGVSYRRIGTLFGVGGPAIAEALARELTV